LTLGAAAAGFAGVGSELWLLMGATVINTASTPASHRMSLGAGDGEAASLILSLYAAFAQRAQPGTSSVTGPMAQSLIRGCFGHPGPAGRREIASPLGRMVMLPLNA